MFADVLTWWAGQMRSLMPGAANAAGGEPDGLIIAVARLGEGPSEACAGEILQRRDGAETWLHSFDDIGAVPLGLSPQPAVILRLPPGSMLSREVKLPLAAARDLSAAIGFEIDRLTPFTADEVYWGVSGVTPDRARNKLNLRLACVRRAPLEPVLAGLAGVRLAPAWIEADGGRIELASGALGSRRVSQNLAGLCGALALACVLAPFLRQELALDATARAVEARTPAALVAETLRQQLATAASGGAAIIEARRTGDALSVLATLTEALPDGNWLSDLTLKAGTLTMDGRSANAALLIGRLAGMPGLHDPGFAAPVTRTADGKQDQFSLYVTAGP